MNLNKQFFKENDGWSEGMTSYEILDEPKPKSKPIDDWMISDKRKEWYKNILGS